MDDYSTKVNCEELVNEDEYFFLRTLYKLLESEEE